MGRSRRPHLWFYYHQEHQLPHVAIRGEHRATVALDTGEVLAGNLSPKLHSAIRRFLSAHRVAVEAACQRVAQCWDLGAHAAFGQLGKDSGVTFTGDQRIEHRAAGHAQHRHATDDILR
ncbi:hypothetical protein BH24ACT15_BH24ACT15_37790 [soil metagenome]